MEAKRAFPRRAPGPPRTTCPAGTRARRAGFSLAELLISVGILSIGLSMCATLFPAALKENERSLNNVLGTLICENALSLGKVSLNGDDPDRDDPANEVENDVLQDWSAKGLGSGSLYPYGVSGKLGCILLARKIEHGGYQLVAVAYRKRKSTNSVQIRWPTCTVNNGNVSSSTADLRVGSPLVNEASGEFGRLVYVAEAHTSGQLEPSLSFSGKCMVVQEKEGTAILEASPGLWTLSSRTGLRIRK